MRTLLLFLLLLPATLIAQDSNSPRFRLYGGRLEVQAAPNLPWAGVVTGTLSNATSYSGLQNATTDLVNYDGSFWDRVTGTPSTTLGHGYVTTPAVNGAYMKRRVAGNIFNPGLFGAAGNNVTNDLAPLNRTLAYIEAIGGGTLKVPESVTYAYGGNQGWLVVGSNTIIDARNGAFRQLANTNTNMMRTRANVTGVGRTQNVTIIGGVWDRGNNGGVNNENHALFLRNIDNLLIEQAQFITALGISKYAIAIGNAVKYTVRDCHFTIGSDAVHITGPAKQGWVGRLSGYAGDDFVAVTTKDYDALNDTHGTVDGLFVGYIRGANTTRIVLLGCTADTIRNIQIDHVAQLGSGALLNIGDGAFLDGRVDNVTLTNAVGNVLVRHWNIGQLSINRVRAKNPIVTFAREGRDAGNGGGSFLGSSGVENAWISECTSLTGSVLEAVYCSDTSVTIGQLHIDKLVTTGGAFSTNGKIRSLAFTNSTVATTQNLAYLNGTIGDVLVANTSVYSGSSGTRIITPIASSSIGSITFQGCSFSAVNGSTGDLVYNTAGGRIGAINVNNTRLVNSNRVLQQTTGLPVTTVQLANLVATGNNRLIETGSPLTVNYSNVTLNSQINNPIRTYNVAASLTVRGSGWAGYSNSAIIRSSTETINVVAPDLPVDPAIVAPTIGNTFYAIGNAVGVPVGPVTGDGGGWLNPTTQPRVLATATGIDGKTVGTTTIYTVPTGKLLVVTRVNIRTTTSNAITAPAAVNVSSGSNSADIFPTQTLTGLTGNQKVFRLTTTDALNAVSAGVDLKLNVTTGATGTAQTWAVEVEGYLR